MNCFLPNLHLATLLFEWKVKTRAQSDRLIIDGE